MALDTSSLGKAIDQLAKGLVEARAEPGRELLRDGVIQRFEYTYELSHKLLRRFLEQTEPSPGEIDGASFAELVRLGSERGLVKSDWDVWRTYRTARGTTSHTYDSAKAKQVFALVPAFLEDARALLGAIERRSSSL